MLGVVIPAYNRADRLEKALHNLEDQTFKRFFTIVVDDGSEEDLKSVCDKSKLNISYIRQPQNLGVSAARQRGLDICRENNIDLVIFMDSDDLYMPHAFDRLTYEINHTNSDIIASGLVWEADHKPYNYLMPPNNTTWVGGKIYRVKALYDNDISFNDKLKTNEDLEFNLKVRYSDMKQKYISETLYLFCNDKRSITRKGDEDSKLCNGIDYIRAIYYSTKWLIEHKKSIEPNIYNLFKCYEYYEYWKEFKKDMPQEIDDMLTELCTLEEFAKILKSCYYWNRIKVNNFFVHDKDVFFFKETFYEFLKNHGYEREV